MGSQEMTKIVDDDKRPFSKTLIQKALRLYIKELKEYMSDSYVDNWKPRMVKMWGYDLLSAKTAWIGSRTQQQVYAKHFLAMVQEKGVRKTQLKFESGWDKASKGARKDQQKREMAWHFNHFNEMTEGVLRKD